jgi:diguanylate cyclase (GGDEF)-like protein
VETSDDDCDRLLAIIDAQNEIMATELGLESVLRLVTSRALALTGADAAIIELGEGDEMVCAAIAGEASATLGTRRGRTASLSGVCMEHRRVLRSDFTTGSDRPSGDQDWVGNGAGSVVCVPVGDGNGGAAVGALQAYAAGPSPFSAEDERTLELLAGLAAARMARAKHFGDHSGDDHRDQLTQLPNRRAYDERLALEAERARRYRRPLSLVLLDLDDFGALNDELGLPAGDEVLAGVAALLTDSRFADEVFRSGADEFAILMPQTDLGGARVAANRIVGQIAAARFAGGRATVSWGAACDQGHPEALHERADAELRAAKTARTDPAATG